MPKPGASPAFASFLHFHVCFNGTTTSSSSPILFKMQRKRKHIVTRRIYAKDRQAWLLSVLAGKTQHLVWQYCFPSYNTEDSFLEWNYGICVRSGEKWGKYLLWLVWGCFEISYIWTTCAHFCKWTERMLSNIPDQLLLFTEDLFQMQYPGTSFPSISSQRFSMNVGQSDSLLPFAALSIWLPVLMFLCLNR